MNLSYAGDSTHLDFLLKNKNIIEVKKTRRNLQAKQLGKQLIIEIIKYKTHPEYKLLFCFVYDSRGYINTIRIDDLNESKSKNCSERALK